MRPVLYFLFFSFISSTLHSQSKLFTEIKSFESGSGEVNPAIGLWWAGHNGWIIKSKSLVITTDILLDYDKRKTDPPITAMELAEILDISFITHGHKDHFNRGTTSFLIENSKCVFVIPESCIPIAEELNMPKDRMVIAKPRVPFEIKEVKVEPIRAIHGNANYAIYYDANLKDCGYVLGLHGTRFLQPGDSHLLEDHLFLKDIDVLFFSPTEHNMYIDPSVILINTLNPSYIFPQHHSTVVVNDKTRFWAKGYQHEVKQRLSNEMKQKYFILNQGAHVLIDKEK